MTPTPNPHRPARRYWGALAWILCGLVLAASTGCKVADLAPGDEEDDEQLTSSARRRSRWR